MKPGRETWARVTVVRVREVVAFRSPEFGLALRAEYRLLGTVGTHTIYGQYFAPNLNKAAEAHREDEYTRSLMAGLC